MKERVQKIVARGGSVSRRGAERLIASGDVTVNGRTVELGAVADPVVDDIRVCGRPVVAETDKVYLAFHKPIGVVSSMRSTHGERTVRDLLALQQRVFPVG